MLKRRGTVVGTGQRIDPSTLIEAWADFTLYITASRRRGPNETAAAIENGNSTAR